MSAVACRCVGSINGDYTGSFAEIFIGWLARSSLLGQGSTIWTIMLFTAPSEEKNWDTNDENCATVNEKRFTNMIITKQESTTRLKQYFQAAPIQNKFQKFAINRNLYKRALALWNTKININFCCPCYIMW